MKYAATFVASLMMALPFSGSAWAQAPNTPKAAKPAKPAGSGRAEWFYSVRFRQQGGRITVDGMNSDARTTLAASDRIVACGDTAKTKVTRLEDIFSCAVPNTFTHRFVVTRGGRESVATLDLSTRAAQVLNASPTRTILGVVFVQWDDAVLVKQVSRTDTPLQIADIVISCPGLEGLIDSFNRLESCKTPSGSYDLRVVRQGKQIPAALAPRK